MTNLLNLIFKHSLLKWVLTFTLIKILVSLYLPLFGDEAYYTVWAQNLQLSYYDHPPFVAWLTSLSLALKNMFPIWDWGLTIRLPFIILSSLSLLIYTTIYQNELTHEKEEASAYWFLLFMCLNPLLGLGGIIATPDVPLVFFWGLAYYCIIKIVRTQKLFWYASLGVFLGLGFCAKYHMALFVPFILISFFLEKRFYQIDFKKLALTILLGFICSLPVLIWNYQNDWASFKFQLDHGFVSKKWNWMWTVTYLTGQILLFNPLLFFKIFQNIKSILSVKTSFIQWLFFTYSSTKASVEANWPITAQAQALVGIKNFTPAFLKKALTYNIALWVIFAILLPTSWGQKRLDHLPHMGIAIDIAKATEDYRPLYGPTYQMSSLLILVTQEKILKLKDLSRFDFFDTLQKDTEIPSQFYTLKYESTDWPEWLTENPHLYSIELIEEYSDWDLLLYKVSSQK